MLKSETQQNDTNGGFIRILLIEDDEDDYVIIRERLAEVLAQAFELRWITQYDEAMAELIRAVYDVCLLDYRLNGHNGLDLLNALVDENVKTPIIFLTGQGDYEVDVQAMKSGASDYLIKDDLTAGLLERTIRYAIDRTNAREALERAHAELEKKVRERTAELAEANQELQKYSEKIRNFAYSISHDLKSPAVSLRGITERLKNKYSARLDEKGKEYCDHICDASEQIISLVEKINIYISAKESDIKIDEIDLCKILKSIREEFSERFTARRICWSESEDMTVIRADRTSVIRVLRNLVDNALKYGGEDLSKIEVGLNEAEDCYILSISDNGAGIKDEHLQQIFEMFARENTNGVIEGSGLGLAIVKEIAEKHRGTVWVDQKSGKGFKVNVSISKTL